jgi:hypothetical protein
VTVCSDIGMLQQFCVPCRRGSYTFDLVIYNDLLLVGDETIFIFANEIPSIYAVLLGRKTIKQHNIPQMLSFLFLSGNQ